MDKEELKEAIKNGELQRALENDQLKVNKSTLLDIERIKFFFQIFQRNNKKQETCL